MTPHWQALQRGQAVDVVVDVVVVVVVVVGPFAPFTQKETGAQNVSRSYAARMGCRVQGL